MIAETTTAAEAISDTVIGLGVLAFLAFFIRQILR